MKEGAAAPILARSVGDIRDAWSGSAAQLGQAMDSGVGFSFVLGGQTQGPVLDNKWRVANFEHEGNPEILLRHQSGLEVRRTTRMLSDFGAVEYQLRFKNTGTAPLPAISALHALNISFSENDPEHMYVVSCGGGLADCYLPPRTFAIRRHSLAPMRIESAFVELTTDGGRSSNKDLPFFFVQNDARRAGLFVAHGWSGQWGARVSYDPATAKLTLRARVPEIQIVLEPGEEIQGPTILVGLYEGDLQVGSNRLRRLLRDVYTPSLAGKRMMPIAMYNTWWNIGENFNEELLRDVARAASEVGQEYYLLDAGWFASPPVEDGGFITGTGNWWEIDRKKLPGGLEGIGDYVRSQGLKFGLWFEPERVAPDSQLARERPEWVLWDSPRELKPWSWTREINPQMKWAHVNHGLLNYGLEEVQAWVRNLLDTYIRKYDLKYIRYDFNIDPLPFWDANDLPNRSGLTQLQYIRGFYAVLDWVRERNPDTVLEGCASGGRRIDLETVRRFHIFNISDQTYDPALIRFHLHGINCFLPGNYNWVGYTQPTNHQKNFQADDLGFQSLFGGAFGTGGRLDLWPEETRKKAILHVETWKKIRRYLVEDYYPLSEQPGDLKCWSGWQFLDPKDQSGFIQSFRTQTAEAKHRFFVKGLEDQGRYRFTDTYSADTFEMTGKAAMQSGIEFVQEPMTSKVFTYIKISEHLRHRDS